MSVFKKAIEANRHIKMLAYGPSGSGKTWFGLAAKECLSKGRHVAYVGNEKGAVHYAKIPELSGFYQINTRDLTKVDIAVAELETGRTDFGLVVVDTLTDMYKSRQRIFERKKDGGTYIPRDAWGSIKRAHDDLVRRLINLPMHVLIIAQEKPLYQKVGNDMEVVGFTIDADKKDEYMFDTVARFFLSKTVSDVQGSTRIGLSEPRHWTRLKTPHSRSGRALTRRSSQM